MGEDTSELSQVDDSVIDAEEVYLLLNDRYRISRNLRVQWYLKTLNTVLEFRSYPELDNENEIVLLSAYSSKHPNAKPTLSPDHIRKFRITTETKFLFLSQKYCFTFMLDLSPSIAKVDIQHETVLTEEIPLALNHSLRALIQSFKVSGSDYEYSPEIYISILTYQPFYSNDSNNSIVHGYKLTANNLDLLMSIVRQKLQHFLNELRKNILAMEEAKCSPISADISLLNIIRFGLLTLNLLPDNSYQGIVIVTDGNLNFPDSNTMESVLSQLRMTMVSLSFIQIGSPMHPNCALGFVPHHDLMDFIARATFGSFIQLSPGYKFDIEPSFNIFHRSFLVWSFHYHDTKYPIQLKTGDYDQRIWMIKNPYFYSTKLYHDNIFDKKDQQWIKKRLITDKFHGNLAQVLCYRLREGFTIKKIKQSGNYLEIFLALLWRSNVIIEYSIRGNLHHNDTVASTTGGQNGHDDEERMLIFEVGVESNYTFLHDVTCAINKPKGHYRANNVKQFWAIIKSFTETDKLGMHFHKFASHDMFRSIPRAVSNGLPLFVMSLQSNTPDVSHNQEDFLKFAQQWRPICMLDMNMCQKSSLHTVQINLLLQHDQPLPEYLYHTNNSGRFDNIQCNQALSALNVTLKEWSTFVLLENHSYIKLIEDQNNKKEDSCSFYLLRIISQPPCVVLYLAFIGGTTNSLRNQIVHELSQKLRKCKLPHRNLSSSLMQTSSNSVKDEFENKSEADLLEDDNILHFSVDNKSQSELSEDNNEYLNSERESFSESTVVSLDENNANDSSTVNSGKNTTSGVVVSSSSSTTNQSCFILLNRSLERMLIRYERIPSDFYSCFGYEEDLKLSSVQQKSYLSIFQTLTRSLFHKRFIWNTHLAPQTRKLPSSSIAKVLSALTTRRLQEGFHLAHNDSGIVNLVLELTLRDDQDCEFSCLVQYVIFPANVTVRNREQHTVNAAADELEDELSTELDDCLIVTECWIEPQNGRVYLPPTPVPASSTNTSNVTQSAGTSLSNATGTISSSNLETNQSFLSGLNYEEIANAKIKERKAKTKNVDSFVLSQMREEETENLKLINSLLTYEHLVSFTTYDPIGNASRSDELYRPIPSNNHNKQGFIAKQISRQVEHEHNVPNDDESSTKTRASRRTLSKCWREHSRPLTKSSSPFKPFNELQNTKQRFNSIRYDFNLLNLISKSQQALIKFPTLKQSFNNKEYCLKNSDDYLHDNDFANIILYSEFLLKILALNEKELELSHWDTMEFIKMNNDKFEQLNYECLFDNIHELQNDDNVVFKCFCKQISECCIVLTILPQSFYTLKTLYRYSMEQYYKESNSFLTIPIFVYKLTFSGLSQILMKTSEDYRQIIHSQDYNLVFDYTKNLDRFVFDSKSKYDSNFLNKFSFSSTTANSQNEVILEHYVKSIEIFYWNAFTDAIYKALRYRININSEDVTFIMNSICRKSSHVIDLTEFLIYTCRHLKPILNDYFEKHRNHSIVNLVENITHGKGEEYSGTGFCSLKELHEILNNCNDRDDCCNSVNNELKINFENKILDHFQLIDCGDKKQSNRTKQCYFFNYENIQRCKYLLENNDENIVRITKRMYVFYKKLDLGIKKLYEISQSRDLHSESNSCKISSSLEELMENDDFEMNQEKKKSLISAMEYDPDADDDDDVGDEKKTKKKKEIDGDVENDKELNVDGEDGNNQVEHDYDDDDQDGDVDSEDDDNDCNQMFISMFLSKPFFINFKYSFIFRDANKHDDELFSTMQTIPTCLMELFQTIPELKNIDCKLDSFRVCLKIELITQNFENPITNFPFEKKLSVISMNNHNLSAFESNLQNHEAPTFADKNIQTSAENKNLEASNEKNADGNDNENDKTATILEHSDSNKNLQNIEQHAKSAAEQIYGEKQKNFLQFNQMLTTICQTRLSAVLDNFQLLNYRDFINKIEWLIRDEIVSMSHNSFPICPNTLQMIVNHISSIKNSNNEKILIDKVDLKFIIDNDDYCLDQFKNMLTNLKFSNFQICRLEQYFYIVLQSSYQVSPIGDRNVDDALDDSDHNILIYTADSVENECDQCFVLNEDFFHNDDDEEEEEDDDDDDEDDESDDKEKQKKKKKIFYTIEKPSCPLSGSSASSLSLKQHFSPNFWLIMTIENDKKMTQTNCNNFISLYYHSRQNVFLCGLQIFNRLKKSLDLLCKKINQKMLLDQLNETRICNDLLISVEDKDPFLKTQIRNALNTTPISHMRGIADSNNPLSDLISNDNQFDFDLIEDDKNFPYFKSNFVPGSFGCDIVWHKHFALHSRINGRDQGINIVKAFLTSFLVNNRNNLYVFKEKSSAVFYFRIYEIECDHKHVSDEKFNSFYDLNDSLDLSKHDEQKAPLNPASMTMSMSNYYDNIIMMNEQSPGEDRDGDKDGEKDNDSIASFSNVQLRDPSLPVQHCILLNVHGISEPTKEIQEDMVNAIQKRLEEATLKQLIVTFTINQGKTFTSDDVNFIQSKYSISENFYFVITEDYKPYLANLKCYIRQNMSTFMYNPKYNDPSPEVHFKLYKNEQFHCVLDDDVFIYNSTDKLSPGIACVILSIVSRDKMTSSPIVDYRLTMDDLNDFMCCNFDNITGCYPQAKENRHVQFYINFQIWACGKVIMEQLKEKLAAVIRNALWDFNMEFKVFKLCNNNLENNFEIANMDSGDGNQMMRARKSGVTLLDTMAFKRYSTSGFSSSFNDQQLPQSSSGDLKNLPDSGKNDYFKFVRSQTLDPSAINDNEKFEKSEKLLNSIEKILLPWLNFSQSLKVPSVKMFTFNIIMRNSLESIFSEFCKLQTFGMKIQYLSNGFYDKNIFENIDYHRKFTILFYYESLWNCSKLNNSSTSGAPNQNQNDSFANYFKNLTKNELSSLNFQPVFLSDEPTTNNGNGSICNASRSKFLLFRIEGKQIMMYFYNWSKDYLETFKTLFTNLIIWNNCKSLLQRSLIMQKAGIFHDLAFEKYKFADILNLSDVNESDLNLQKILPNIDNEKFFKNIELLLKYNSPVNALKELKDLKITDCHSKLAELLFETKNYSFIFSTINDEKRKNCKNLYEFFQLQFNSNYNNYIKDLKDLTNIWELSNNKLNSANMDRIVSLIKSYGRLTHFCLTPFLFNEKWRHNISLIRDHTLQITSRNRHMSGFSSNKSAGDEFQINKRSRRKSGPPNMFDNIVGRIGKGHDDGPNFVSVKRNFMQEYIQYLQSALGFSTIKSQKWTKNTRFTNFNHKFSIHNRDEFSSHYCIKNVFGNLLVFEIGFCEPYVYSYLYSFDSGQLSVWNRAEYSMSSINTFLDELDSIKVRMHLHSFTYDYHLRAIHSYISGVKFLFIQGYHLISFLDDFIKYYQKAPNYARNYVFCDNIRFESKRLTSEHLYDYIITNNKLYGLDVFDMRPQTLDNRYFETKNEYVLIQLTSYQVPLSSDETKFYQDENFSVGILITYQKSKPEIAFQNKDSTTLLLKFFVILTSQRITFPKLISLTDHCGAFRTIRLLSSSFSNSRKSSILHSGDSSMENSFNMKSGIGQQQQYQQDKQSSFNRNLYEGLSLDAVQSFPGITDERINYMGYFNAHEMNMLNLLNEKAAEIKKQLRTIITAAEVDCRRDFLWNCFLPMSPLTGQLNVSGNESVSMESLEELLTLVEAIRFDEYDLNLSQFYQFNHNWYKNLAMKLEARFEQFSRRFQNEQQFMIVLFKPGCKECFVLFEWNSSTQTVNFRLVFKRPPKTVIDSAFLQSCPKQCHELVEDIVNIATAHMWSMLI